LSSNVNSKTLDRPVFPSFVLSLKQGEEDADARFLCRELLHNLNPPLYLLGAPFNDIGNPDMLPPIGWMIHIKFM
jgi:hypothetical protein